MHDEPDVTSRPASVWLWLLPALAVAAGLIGFGLAGEREKAVVGIAAPIVLGAMFLYMASRRHVSRQGRMGYLSVVAGGVIFYLADALLVGSPHDVLAAVGAVLALFGAATVVRAMMKAEGTTGQHTRER